MANETNEIDSLSIGITVNDKGSSAKINQFAKAIDSLVSSLKGLESMQSVLKTLEGAMAGIGRSSKSISNKTKNAFAQAPQMATATEGANGGILPQINKNSRKGIDNLTQSLGKVETQTKKTTSKFSQFFSSVKRIALYRAIRTALKEITQAMQYGIQNYARYDDATNKAMSNVMNSVNQLKNTLGVTLGQIMQTLAPLIETLTNAVVGLLDNLNMALASLGNKSTYSRAIKQNEDYAKSIDKVNGKLLSFDTFNTLATNNGQSKGLFEEVEMPAELEGFPALLKEIIGLLKELFEENKVIFELVLDIIKLLQPLLHTAITIISTIVQQIRGAFQIIDGFIKLLMGDFNGAWESIGDGFKNMLKGSLNMFISVVNLIIDAINFLITKLNPIGWIFGAAGIDISIPHIPLASFANGGSFNTADAFYANENGRTELIASTNNGGAVMTLEQWADVSYLSHLRALQDSGDKEVVLKVDQNTLGRVVANSAGFISETNRIKLIKV